MSRALRRSAYTFWDGYRYEEDITQAAPVMKDIEHGAVFQSELFGQQKPWVFVGNNRLDKCHVVVGAAPSLEGPWENMTAVHEANGLTVVDKAVNFVYPHEWALRDRNDELLITWSEGRPGGVVGARFRFGMGMYSASRQQ